MTIAYLFLSDAASISAYSQDENFPVANIKDKFLTVRYKPTDVTGQYVDFDFGAATSIDCLCLNSNLTASATITVKGASDAAFTTDLVTHNIAESGEQNIFESFTSYSRRYWRVEFADSSLSEIAIGRMVLTTIYSFASFRLRPKVEYATTAKVRYSNSGQAHGISGYEYRIFDLTFPDPTKAQRQEIEAIFSSLKNYTPFFANIFPDDEFAPVYVVIDQDSLKMTVQAYGGYSMNLKLREAF